MRKSHSVLLIAVLMTSLTATVFAADSQNALPAGVVNINTADVTQLTYLPRVGRAAAQRVIDYREEHGPFAKTSDLMQVKGFGEKTFERIARYLTVDGKTTLSAKIKLPVKPRTKPSNTASE